MTGLLFKTNCVVTPLDPIEPGEIRDPIVDLVSIYPQFGSQLADNHRSAEFLKNFELPIIPIHELLDAVLD